MLRIFRTSLAGLYHVRLMTYYMNPHPALARSPLPCLGEGDGGIGRYIVTVYMDMILQVRLSLILMV